MWYRVQVRMWSLSRHTLLIQKCSASFQRELQRTSVQPLQFDDMMNWCCFQLIWALSSSPSFPNSPSFSSIFFSLLFLLRLHCLLSFLYLFFNPNPNVCLGSSTFTDSSFYVLRCWYWNSRNVAIHICMYVWVINTAGICLIAINTWCDINRITSCVYKEI